MLEGFEADIPQVMVESQIDKAIEDMGYRLSMQGINLESYLQMTGGTMDKIRESFKDRAERQVKVSLALKKVAELENIEVTEEQIAQEYEKLSKLYNMPVEKIKGMLSDSSVKQDMLTERALQVVKDSAVVTEKASGKDAEEENDKPAPAKKKAKARKKEDSDTSAEASADKEKT
jgi:trigger factor